MIPGPAAHDGPHGGVEAESVGVVEILVAGQAALGRLTQQRRQAVARVLSGALVLQLSGGRGGEVEGVVEFAVGQQAGIAGDLSPEEADLEAAVELRSERLG